jgi:hypothetical protein
MWWKRRTRRKSERNTEAEDTSPPEDRCQRDAGVRVAASVSGSASVFVGDKRIAVRVRESVSG